MHVVKLRASLFLLLLLACIGCDHAAKTVARASLAPGERVSLLADTVRLELVQNPGAFLSLGAALPPSWRTPIFLLLVPVSLALICWAGARSGLADGRTWVGLALVVGGGLANWIDRLAHAGAVTDFLNLGVGALRTGIFNIADVSIVAGAILWAFAGRAASRPEG